MYSVCMARRNISLHDDLDDAARRAGINVSAVTQSALEAELDRRARMDRLGAWLDELDEKHGPPTKAEMRDAERWWASRQPVVPAPDRRRPA